MEKTAIQQLFSELENLHPHLFNIYSTEGREFINHFHKFLEIEKQQIRSAYIDGQDDIIEQCKFKPEYHLNSLHYYQKKYESS